MMIEQSDYSYGIQQDKKDSGHWFRAISEIVP